MVCVQSMASTPIVRAFEAGSDDIEPRPAGRTIATGLNVAQNVGHINVLRIIRATGGCAVSVSDDAIRAVIRAEWRAAAVRLVAGRRRDARRAPRAGRPRNGPSQRPSRAGQHGVRREVSPHHSATPGRRSLGAVGVFEHSKQRSNTLKQWRKIKMKSKIRKKSKIRSKRKSKDLFREMRIIS